MRTLTVGYQSGVTSKLPVGAAFKLKLPRKGADFFPVTFADGGRGFLTTAGLISARVTETLPEEDK